MPVLFILAGPNGTGKTTYYNSAIQRGFISPRLPFLNIDIIAKDELGGYTPENFAKAEMIFRERVGKLLNNCSDFMIESNLAKSSDYDWLQNMMKHGYDLVLYFLCTADVNININRVAWRVREGGHDIPVEIILHRYAMGLTYLKGKMHLFKEVHLVDNSTDEAIEVAQVLEGKLNESIPELPVWAEEVLFIVKRKK